MRKLFLFCTIVFMISCKPTQLSTVILMEQAPLIIYKTNGVLALPVKLNKWYLLDKVIDPDPFLEMYECGNWNEFQDSIKKINKIITQDFKGYKDLMN